MKNQRYYRVLSTVRSVLYLSLLIALAWFLIENSEARATIGAFGLTLTWIVILLGVVLIVVRWQQQQRAPMIYPFLNSTGDKENKEKYDALALNFSELLQLEIQRITYLLYIPESIAVHNPAFSKEQVPRPIISLASPTALGSARVEEELGEMLKGIGALSLGPVSLPLGGLLYLLIQALQGGGITGTIQKFGGTLSVVASYANRKYETRSDILSEKEQSDETVVRGLARQLAYMMISDFADFPPSRWQGFKEVIEGLEEYRHYLLSGKRNLSTLDAAHKHFEQATVEDSQYAWAYYNLGLLYEELGNLDSAFEMYKRAVQAEPNLREAQFQLGQAYFQRGQLLNAVNAGRRALELSEKARKPFPVARTSLGKWLYNLSYESQNNFADALKYCNEALAQLKAAKKEYTRLIRQERRRVDFSEQRLAALKAGAIYSLMELGQAYQILANFLEKATQENAFRRKIVDARKRAENALQQCLKLYPESSAAHAELGGFYMEQKNYSLAQKYLESAGSITPEDKSIVLGLGATYLSPAIDVLPGLIKEFQENPQGWQTNWPEQRISATQSQLRLAEVHYQTVIDLIRSQGEAGVDEQNSMIKALNGLASVYGAQALIQCVQNNDCTSLVINAKQFLGKALVLNPFASEVYDNLAGIYAIESAIYDLMSKDIAANEGKVIDAESADITPPPIATSPSANETIEQAYATLTEYVRNYGAIDPHSTTGIVMALAASTVEQRTSKELVSQFFMDGSLTLPSPDKIETSPVSQVYLWVASWMFVTIGMLELGIQYLERAQELGQFPELALVDYDLGNVYLGLREWNKAAKYFQKMAPADPYYWQSRVTLADTLRNIESLGANFVNETSFAPNVPSEISESSEPTEEYQDSVQETALVALPSGEPEDAKNPEQEKVFLPEETLDAERVYTDSILVAGSDPYRRATALAARADLRRDKKKYDAAISDCKESLGLVPAYAYPHRILALIYMDLYDYDRAIEHWEHVGDLIQDLDESQYHQGLGDAYSSKAVSSSDPVKAETWRWQAVQEYQHAIRLLGLNESADKANTLIVLGNILMDLMQFKEAETAYLAALEISRGTPDEYNLHVKLAFVYIKRGLYSDAYFEYKKAITLCEEQLKKALETSDVQASGKFAGGLSYASNMLAYYLHAERGVNLEEGLTLVNRALAELEHSNLDEAARGESRGAYLDTRGWLYYRQGKYSAAKQDLEEALSLTMGTVFEHGHLALVYERLAESSESDTERKCLQTLSSEQWKLAFDLDREGIWSAYKRDLPREVAKQ